MPITEDDRQDAALFLLEQGTPARLDLLVYRRMETEVLRRLGELEAAGIYDSPSHETRREYLAAKNDYRKTPQIRKQRAAYMRAYRARRKARGMPLPRGT